MILFQSFNHKFAVVTKSDLINPSAVVLEDSGAVFIAPNQNGPQREQFMTARQRMETIKINQFNGRLF